MHLEILEGDILYQSLSKHGNPCVYYDSVILSDTSSV